MSQHVFDEEQFNTNIPNVSMKTFFCLSSRFPHFLIMVINSVEIHKKALSQNVIEQYNFARQTFRQGIHNNIEVLPVAKTVFPFSTRKKRFRNKTFPIKKKYRAEARFQRFYGKV